MVDHPEHYQGNKFEVIDIIEDYDLGFCLGNAVKYILRAGKKDDIVQDINKAIWYLERFKNNLSKKENKEINKSKQTTETPDKTNKKRKYKAIKDLVYGEYFKFKTSAYIFSFLCLDEIKNRIVVRNYQNYDSKIEDYYYNPDELVIMVDMDNI